MRQGGAKAALVGRADTEEGLGAPPPCSHRHYSWLRRVPFLLQDIPALRVPSSWGRPLASSTFPDHSEFLLTVFYSLLSSKTTLADRAQRNLTSCLTFLYKGCWDEVRHTDRQRTALKEDVYTHRSLETGTKTTPYKATRGSARQREQGEIGGNRSNNFSYGFHGKVHARQWQQM